MAMKPLNPAPVIRLVDSWTLLATEAGRYKEGLRTTTFLRNGTLRESQTLTLSDPKARRAAAKTFAATSSLNEATLEGALLDLLEGVEGVLQEHEGRKVPTLADHLVTLAIDNGVELFHTPDGEAYATITVEGPPLRKG